MADTEKTYESKNIKFFYENAQDKKILDFFEKEKKKKSKIKFGTIAKKLVLEYIENIENSKDLQSSTNFNEQLITKEEVSEMIKKAMEGYKKDTSSDNNIENEISISKVTSEKEEKYSEKKSSKKSNKPNLLQQIKKQNS